MAQLIIPTINFCKNSWVFLIDLLFPKFCFGCQKEGEWICNNCKKKIVFIKNLTCPGCNRLSKNGKFCRRCREKSNLTGLIPAAYYEDGPLKEAIHSFKYEGVFDLSRDLGRLLHDMLNLKTFTKWNQVNIVLIPVPLHKRRQGKRGYNQAELLAKEIKNKYPDYWLLNNLLTRVKHTKKSQAELAGRARRENVQGVFAWRGKSKQLQEKRVLLIDDIHTTGATLEECAKVLREQAGAKEVWGIVIAKA